MEFDILGIVIGLILLALFGFIIKAFIVTRNIKRKGDYSCLLLKEQLSIISRENSKNSKKQQIANSFNDSIVERLVELTKRLLSIQKFIFEEHF